MAKLFLSHASGDDALADEIGQRLSLRHQIFVDHTRQHGIAPGAEWERSLYERLDWADAVVCLVTTRYVESRWCFAEVALAKANGRRLFPLTAEEGAAHPLLAPTQGVAYARDPVEALARLDDALAALDAGGGIARNERRPVFPGLEPFETEDRAVFFGRDREIRALAQDLRARVAQRQPRALVIVGASGSGKSSLLRAGLVPHLLDEPAWWRLRPFRPGASPLDALAEAIARTRKDVGLAPDYANVRASLPGGLSAQVAELLLSAPQQRTQCLLCVDQLEELFTRASESERRMCVELLGHAATAPDGGMFVAATLRSDFVAELMAFPEAAPLRERPFLLAPLERAALETVITGPAKAAHIVFDPDVISAAVDDTGSGTALPLLAFTLSRLADGRTRITRADYDSLGGVRGALESQAEAALANLRRTGHAEADVLQTLMRFVSLDDAGRPTSRRCARAGFGASGAIVDAFVDGRLVTADGDMLGVAHETLFTAWPRLDAAIQAGAEDLRLRRAMERDAADWDAYGRSAAILWRGERLAHARRIAERAAELDATGRAFLDASEAQELEAARRSAAILVDRVLSSDIPDRDPEMALLYFLVTIDEHAETPDAVAGLRRALAVHRKVAHVGPLVRPELASLKDDGRVLAIAAFEDLPPSPSVRPAPRRDSTVLLMLWRIGEHVPFATATMSGRVLRDLQWAPDGSAVSLVLDDRTSWWDGTTPAPVAEPIVRAAAGGPVTREAATAVAADPAREPITPPARFTHLIECVQADRLLDLQGTGIDIYQRHPIDSPVIVPLDTTLVWRDGPSHEPAAPIVAASRSGDGRRIALAFRTAIEVREIATDALIARLGEHDDEEGDVYTSVWLDYDGTSVVSGSIAGHRSKEWDVASGAIIRDVDSVVAEYSYDRRLSAWVTPSGDLWVVSGEQAVRLATDQRHVRGLVLDSTGSSLLAVAPGAPVVEHAISGNQIAASYPATLEAVAFSHDGRHVLGRRGAEVYQWPDRSPAAVIDRARAAVYRTLTVPERHMFEIPDRR